MSSAPATPAAEIGTPVTCSGLFSVARCQTLTIATFQGKPGQTSSAATRSTATAPQMLPVHPHPWLPAQQAQGSPALQPQHPRCCLCSSPSAACTAWHISQDLHLPLSLSQHPGCCMCMPPAAACAACQGQRNLVSSETTAPQVPSVQAHLQLHMQHDLSAPLCCCTSCSHQHPRGCL